MISTPTKRIARHSELPPRDWPNLLLSASHYFSYLGFPTANAKKDIQARYHRNNWGKVKESLRAWHLRNPGYQARPDRREYKRQYAARRSKQDPRFRLEQYLRTRIYDALKGARKSARTRELLGCTILELRAHLESRFRPGMTWENYGPVWHVDHRRPCANFDLLDPAQQQKCFHYTNLQPLFAKENLRKGAR